MPLDASTNDRRWRFLEARTSHHQAQSQGRLDAAGPAVTSREAFIVEPFADTPALRSTFQSWAKPVSDVSVTPSGGRKAPAASGRSAFNTSR